MRARLLFLLKYTLFWLGFFVTGKLVFLLWYWAQTKGLPLTTLFGIVIHGLRMDAAATAYVSALVFILVALSAVVPWRFLRPVILAWSLLLLFVVVGLTLGDLKLYEEWGFRIDATWVRYLETPAGVAATIADTPLFALFVVWALLFVPATWLLFKRVVPATMEPPGSWAARIPAFLTPLLGAALLVIPARGGLQLTSLNYSSVYFSSSDYANQATLNVLWNFLNSFYRGGSDRTNPYEVMPAAEATAIRDSLLRRGGPAPAESLLRMPRPNVIIIIWEGFTAKAVGALGGRPGIAPRFDSLVGQGVFFDRFYASGNRTDKGVAAILAGYPALPKTAVLKEPRKYAGLPGLGRSFAGAGYVTGFLKGGELEFANIRAFVLQNGFTRLVERKDFPSSTWNSKWGAHDHVLLERVLAEADTTTTPFFFTALTLSSHEPYDIPVEHVFGDSTKEARYLSALHYTDSSVAHFIREARARPWWDSTLIIIVPDHGHRLPSIDLTSDQYREETHHIPMLWLGGALKTTGIRVHALGDHNDLAPTLLAQLGIPHDDFLWGQDLFAAGRTPFAYYTFSDGFGYLTERGGLMWDNVGQRVLRSYGTTAPADQRAGAALQQLFVGDFVAR
jgi:phosphoglycerol transferase MdoB-like AlkP superfamily enzyme